MNNFEKIKAMDIDEMAEWLNKIECNEDCCRDWNCNECVNGFKQWLESEVRE